MNYGNCPQLNWRRRSEPVKCPLAKRRSPRFYVLDAVNPLINAVVAHRPELGRWSRRIASTARLLAAKIRGRWRRACHDQDQYRPRGFRHHQRYAFARKASVAEVNSPAVDNLQKAGAVLLGRGNSPTFALRWFTSNQVHGRTLNPRDPSLTPGGSSGGGRSAAVTAGIGQIALGTDIGGSIRYPAYACGIHGLRPTPSDACPRSTRRRPNARSVRN